jgi:hypothetical protein
MAKKDLHLLANFTFCFIDHFNVNVNVIVNVNFFIILSYALFYKSIFIFRLNFDWKVLEFQFFLIILSKSIKSCLFLVTSLFFDFSIKN